MNSSKWEKQALGISGALIGDAKKNPHQRLDLVPETAITGNITEFINFLASVRETFDLHATLQNLIPNVWVVAHFR